VLPRQAHGGEFANFIVRPRMFHMVALKEYFSYIGDQQEHTGMGVTWFIVHNLLNQMQHYV
jgi:hypothetical protein